MMVITFCLLLAQARIMARKYSWPHIISDLAVVSLKIKCTRPTINAVTKNSENGALSSTCVCSDLKENISTAVNAKNGKVSTE